MSKLLSMSSNRSNRSITATQRLKRDYINLKRDPVPYVTAEPLSSNILEWRYVLRGPDDTPYYGGYYHGKLIFPRQFPYKPPAIYMFTPSGRFICNQRLCLSISDYHPELWSPAWSVTTILTGLLSFMVEDTAAWGSVWTSVDTKLNLAKSSGTFNLRNATFCELFPDIVKDIEQILAETSANGKPKQIGNAARLNPEKSNRVFMSAIVLLGAAAFALLLWL